MVHREVDAICGSGIEGHSAPLGAIPEDGPLKDADAAAAADSAAAAKSPEPETADCTLSFPWLVLPFPCSPVLCSVQYAAARLIE